MEVPSHILPSTSKLQSVSIFEPLEGVNDIEGITALFNQLRNAFDDKNDDDEYIFGLVQEGCSFGRDFFLLVLIQGTPAEISNLLRCIKQIGTLTTVWPHLVSAIIHCVQGNCLVLKYDMRKYFRVLKALFAVVSDDVEMAGNYASLLHSMRPLQMPIFGFVWIELASDRQFLVNMISSHADFITTIISDFIVAVSFLNESVSQAVFEKLYRGLLRFLLIIRHDFPGFLATIAPEIVTLLPQSFVQVRNIVLSAQPPGIRTTSILEARTALAGVPDIDSFSAAQQPFKSLCDQLRFGEAIQHAGILNEMAGQFEGKPGLISAFVVYLSNSGLPSVQLEQILTGLESIQGFVVISNLIERFLAKPDVVLMLINAMIDQLRYPSRTTLFFYFTLVNLFGNDRNPRLPGGMNELILRAVIERASRPPPHPWGLKLLVTNLLGNAVWALPFVNRSEAVTKFLKATAVTFGLGGP
jgi:CCR4-NOT transcription complex subunit 1